MKNVTFWCVADWTAGTDGAAMENITPPMPAKRALAALDQPAAADIGPPKRISKKVPLPIPFSRAQFIVRCTNAAPRVTTHMNE
jgi:hypothetical protein